MIVPAYWAEARLQDRSTPRQVTVRRFGFSDESQEAAEAHAETRAREALVQILAGAKLPRRERKQTYAGGDGLPIREEIVGRHGDVVVTRNGYGARCLNVSDVLFVDVDFVPTAPSLVPAFVLGVVGVAIVIAVSVWICSVCLALGGTFLVCVTAGSVVDAWRAASVARRGGAESLTTARVRAFSRAHPDLHLRVYGTPAGLRVLVMSRTFDPRDPITTAYFSALGADPLYAQMCRLQRCFRARLSPKPWRIGLPTLSKITRAVWPVPPSVIARRAAWIERYEIAAQRYAACRFIESLGSDVVDERTEQVRRVHDDACRATELLPLA